MSGSCGCATAMKLKTQRTQGTDEEMQNINTRGTFMEEVEEELDVDRLEEQRPPLSVSPLSPSLLRLPRY